MTDTRDKLNEAQYFIDRMKETNCYKNAFRYNLSAFLSAFRSITLFMQKEFNSVDGFTSWYKIKQSQMMSDKILKFFNEQRVQTIHVQPISARPSQNQMNIPEIDLTRLNNFSITSNINKDGIMDNPVLTRTTNEGESTVEEVTATTLWVFSDLPLEDNFSGKDIVSLCEEKLTQLQTIAQECEQNFVKNIE